MPDADCVRKEGKARAKRPDASASASTNQPASASASASASSFSVLPLLLQNPSADSKLRIHSEQFKSTRENPCQNSGTQSVGSTSIFYGGKYQKIFSYLPSFAPKDPKARHLAQTPSPPCRRCGGTSRSWAHRRRSGAARQNACRHPRRCVRRTSAAARGDRREQRAADPGDGDGGGRQKGHDMYGREGFAFAICGGEKNL